MSDSDEWREVKGKFEMMNNSLHLLVVDDDQRICLLLKKFLSKSGYRVTVAYGASQARQLIKSFKFVENN